MKFRIEIVPQAERDLDDIYLWLARRSPQGARTWHLRWLEVLDYLEEFADKAPVAPEDEDQEARIQHFIFKTRRGRRYRAIFTLDENIAYVLHVRGPGQRLVSKKDLRLPPHLT